MSRPFKTLALLLLISCGAYSAEPYYIIAEGWSQSTHADAIRRKGPVPKRLMLILPDYPFDQVQPKMEVLFKNTQSNRKIVHDVIIKGDRFLLTKGRANVRADVLVDRRAYLGRAIFIKNLP